MTVELKVTYEAAAPGSSALMIIEHAGALIGQLLVPPAHNASGEVRSAITGLFFASLTAAVQLEHAKERENSK